LKKSGIKEAIIIQGPERDIENELKGSKLGINIKYVVQPAPKGTGDALWRARDLIKENFLLLGPHKIDFEKNFFPFLQKIKGNNKKIILFGAKTERPWDFGIIKFKGNRVLKIVENPVKGKEPSRVKATEVYLLPAVFLNYLKKVKKGEESLIDAINLYLKENSGHFFLLKKDTVSLKYSWDLLSVSKLIFASDNFKNRIARSLTIGKNVVIKGKVFIGSNTKIGDNTVIYGPVYIAENCQIGANNVIRGPVNLEKNTLTGSLCEIKNAIVQEKTHFHSGYIGDSVIGRNCRFGAGFIAANRRIDRKNIKTSVMGKKTDTGLTYFGVVVGDNARFGVRVSAMPGILIGSEATVGPNTVVLKNIKENTKFFIRQKTLR
jgi:bifunctional UDP-N-acetylglucosamine pyrophosphorylase/glucosamine-1-phosphate N-acetyltransferase